MHRTSAEHDRDHLIAWVQEALDDVTPGQFLLIEYLSEEGLPVEPYAQAALDPGGWWCEVVSAHHLPPDRWPLDETVLQRDGWLAPIGRHDNYWFPDVELPAAARLLVDALWSGRSCPDPDRYALSIGTFPSGPDSGETSPLPDGLPLAA